MTDERDGLPSGSELPRLMHCPGSHNAIASLPKREDTAESMEGTQRHELIEEKTVELSETREQERAVKMALDLTQKALEIAGFDKLDDVEELTEQRLWMHDDELNPVCSGKFDRLFIHRPTKTGIVIDYKTLYGDHGHAGSNQQLLFYSLLAAEEHDLSTVHRFLIQPLLEREKQLTHAVMFNSSMNSERKTFLDVLKRAMEPDAKRIPHPKACKNCDFAPDCPEATAASLALTATDPSTLVLDLNGQTWERINAAEKQIKKLKAAFSEKALEAIAKDPNSAPGLKVKKGSTRKSVNDAPGVWQKLNGIIEPDDFIAATTVSLTKLEKPYKEAQGIKSIGAARKQLEAHLEDLITTKTTSPSLVAE